MRFRQYHEVKAFDHDTRSLLLQQEAQNVLLLGNLMIGVAGQDTTTWRNPAHWLMAVVTDGPAIRLIALMTPPHNITLCAVGNDNREESAACLAAGLRDAGIAVPGVTAEKTLAKCFARAYADAVGTGVQERINHRIYALSQVNVSIPETGVLRLAQESDLAFLPYWIAGFQSDCFATDFRVSETAEEARYHIDSRKLYLWESNGTPVSMVKVNRELQTVCCIGYVYTPPYFRGKGYATACVAGVSLAMLRQGFTACALYADLANPISNGIYQKIGYKPICDSMQIAFEA